MTGIQQLRRVLAVFMVLTVLLLVFLLWRDASAAQETDGLYMLTVVGSEVVLYQGERFITSYEGIVPENLPYDDRRALEAGILFATRAEADRAIEDYDG